jgi:hypothetical protein
MPCEAIFAEPRRPGHLPLQGALLRLHGDYAVLLACKRADVGGGIILRLWNPGDIPAETRVESEWLPMGEARLTGVTEEDDEVPPGAELLRGEGRGLRLRLSPRAIATVRVLPPE